MQKRGNENQRRAAWRERVRDGQRKESLVGIKRVKTGTGKAGDKPCVDIIKDREGKPVSTKGSFSPEPETE